MSKQKEVCDIQGCNNKAETVVVLYVPDSYTEIAMCSYHYKDFKSEEGLDKPFNMKDDVIAKYKHN
jgi:hypothetical protein